MEHDLVGPMLWNPIEGSSLTEFWIDWLGYGEFWTIHRAM